MFKLVYEFKTNVTRSVSEDKTKSKFVDACIIYDTVKDEFDYIYTKHLKKLEDIVDIDMNLDRSIFTKINGVKVKKVLAMQNIDNRYIENIVVEHIDDIQEHDLIVRGIVEGITLYEEISEISNNSKDMKKLYMYYNDNVLHFLTTAKYIMLPRDLSNFSLFSFTSCKNLILNDFILDPETTTISYLFESNSYLENLELNSFDFSNVQKFNRAFHNCKMLNSLMISPKQSRYHDANNEKIYIDTCNMFSNLKYMSKLDLRFCDCIRIDFGHLWDDSMVLGGNKNNYNIKDVWVYSSKFQYGKAIYFSKWWRHVENLYVNEKLYKYIKSMGKSILKIPNSYKVCVHCYKDNTNEIIDSF